MHPKIRSHNAFADYLKKLDIQVTFLIAIDVLNSSGNLRNHLSKNNNKGKEKRFYKLIKDRRLMNKKL